MYRYNDLHVAWAANSIYPFVDMYVYLIKLRSLKNDPVEFRLFAFVDFPLDFDENRGMLINVIKSK